MYIRFAEVLLIHAEAENELNGPTAKAYASLISKGKSRIGPFDRRHIKQRRIS